MIGRIKNNRWIFVLLAVWTLAGCGDDLLTGGEQYDCPGAGVFVCNEGNFMYGNASLSYYDPAEDTVYNQVFYNANNFPLGDVCQSMSIIDGKGFVVVNNSGKVYVVDVNTFKYIGAISGLTSPRYIQQVSPDKIYISDLYSPSMAIADPTTLQVTGHVYMGTTKGPGKVNGTEQMVMHGSYVYVCSWSYNDKVYKVDTRTDRVVDSLTVTKQPNSMVLDKNGKIWVLSDGGYAGSPYGQERATLIRIDAEQFAVEQIYRFPDAVASPSELCINRAGDRLYFINGSWASGTVPNSGVYAMGVEETSLPSQPFVAEEGRLFYALSVDPYTDQVYISDAIDYTQRGLVFRYSPDGRLLSRFRVDIIPGAFCFKPDSGK